MPAHILGAHLRPQDPDFLDLPWDRPLSEWAGASPRVLELERGLSRHDVQFVGYGERTYAIKQTTVPVAEREFAALVEAESRHLPCVRASGWLAVETREGEQVGMLVSEFLERSIPYRSLFRASGMERYRERLLDAMAGLLVRLHLGGFYWGDCSLSNTLFRRDAGELSAYLVDAETSEFHESLSDGLREQDLTILEENVAGDLADLVASGQPAGPLQPWDTGAIIRQRYEALWREVTREELVTPGEGWKIQERLRALNALGFSVGEVELIGEDRGARLRLRTIVTDRDYHRHQLHDLTGLSVEERQAQQILNEIRELRAQLAASRNQSVSLSAAAYDWQHARFEPATEQLAPLVERQGDAAEVYCQLLEHKWFLSEREQRDVGFERALADFAAQFGKP